MSPESQVAQVEMAFPDPWELREPKVTPEPPESVCQASQVRTALQVCPAPLVLEVLRVLLAHLVLQVPLVMASPALTVRKVRGE